MYLETSEPEVDALRNIENQLCLQIRLFESAMTKPDFGRKRAGVLLTAQNVYWGALFTLMGLPESDPEKFSPVHAELCRLRAALKALKM